MWKSRPVFESRVNKVVGFKAICCLATWVCESESIAEAVLWVSHVWSIIIPSHTRNQNQPLIENGWNRMQPRLGRNRELKNTSTTENKIARHRFFTLNSLAAADSPSEIRQRLSSSRRSSTASMSLSSRRGESNSPPLNVQLTHSVC